MMEIGWGLEKRSREVSHRCRWLLLLLLLYSFLFFCCSIWPLTQVCPCHMPHHHTSITPPSHHVRSLRWTPLVSAHGGPALDLFGSALRHLPTPPCGKHVTRHTGPRGWGASETASKLLSSTHPPLRRVASLPSVWYLWVFGCIYFSPFCLHPFWYHSVVSLPTSCRGKIIFVMAQTEKHSVFRLSENFQRLRKVVTAVLLRCTKQL